MQAILSQHIATVYRWSTAALVSFLMVGVANAHYLGVQGQLFPIEEVDMRQLLAESLSQVDTKKIEEELTTSAETFFERLPASPVPSADKTVSRWIDPSIEITSEVRVPVKDPVTGEWAWKMMHPAGTKVNPLEHVQPRDRMLFFNAASLAEVEFVKAVILRRKLDIIPVATGGNIKPLFEEIKRPVFFANEAHMARFHVKATPSLLGVGEGAYSRYLVITEIRLPATPDIVDKAWYGLPAGLDVDTPAFGD